MNATLTNGAVLARHNINADSIEHLDVEVLLLTGMQSQGDLLILPTDRPAYIGSVIPSTGVLVVMGEKGRNAHILHALEGACHWKAAAGSGTRLLQGWLTVPEGSSATLVHTQEHSVLGVGAGTYEIRRQREFAGVWRRLAD